MQIYKRQIVLSASFFYLYPVAKEIKFFIVPSGHPKLRYQHEIVSLCEGLRDAGHLFYGNCNYWLEPVRKKYLIEEAPSGFDAEVHVYNTYYFTAFPEAFLTVDYSKVNVLIDREDGLYGEYCNRAYEKFDLILRTHYNGYIDYDHYHPNIQPWAFGLSERIINTVDKSRDLNPLKRTLLTFRLEHTLRAKAVVEMSPAFGKNFPIYKGVTTETHVEKPAGFTEEELVFWDQSGHRHDPEFYRSLNSSLLTFAFGGFIYPRPFADTRFMRPFQKISQAASSILRGLGRDDSSCYFIDQFDSWRWWESMYSNTCPIHMNFSDWKFILPEMPEDKVHYWGVSRFNFEASAIQLAETHPDDLRHIGIAGSKWTSKHYSPAAIAERFLKHINKEVFK
jgi:hypothetical protein